MKKDFLNIKCKMLYKTNFIKISQQIKTLEENEHDDLRMF